MFRVVCIGELSHWFDSFSFQMAKKTGLKKPPPNPLALEKAKAAVLSGEKLSTVAKKFGIPRNTLRYRIAHPTPRRRGTKPTLSQKDEQAIVNWLQDCARKGYPKRKQDIIKAVKLYVQKHNLETPFKNDKPGHKWLTLFLKRHPNIVYRKSEAVTSASANVSEANIRKWFTEIDTYNNNNNNRS